MMDRRVWTCKSIFLLTAVTFLVFSFLLSGSAVSQDSQADSATTSVVVDTGMTRCYDSNGNEILPCPKSSAPYYGQDGSYAGVQPSYKKNTNGTVTDLNLGLMWQKEDDGNYRNYNDAVTYCDDLVLGGKSDWRLPTVNELESLVNYGKSQISIDTSYFPNCKAEFYWSSTVWPISSDDLAWGVTFDTGYNYYGKIKTEDQDYTHLARCVRSVQ